MSDARKKWLEVSLNGAHSKSAQPNGPHDAARIIEEGIACAEAGAAIVHFHAFEGDSDKQLYDSHAYGRIIEGIRKHTDAIVYGTVPMIGGFDGARLLPPGERYRPSEELMQSGLLEWLVIDAGLVNFGSYAGIAQGEGAGMYLNPVSYVRYAMDLTKRYNTVPTCGIWEPGFLRTAAATAKAAGVTRKIVYKMNFSQDLTLGLPPEPYALECYEKLIRQFAPDAAWMAACASADIFPLAPQALALGGHLRVGLEDARNGCPQTNLELVERGVKIIQDNGYALQTPAGVRKEIAAAV